MLMALHRELILHATARTYVTFLFNSLYGELVAFAVGYKDQYAELPFLCPYWHC
jgi:hypothetical protein